MLLAATVLVHGWAGDALSPSMEKAGSEAPTETVLGQFTLQGDYQEAWGFLPLFWKTFLGPDAWNSLIPPGSPQGHLSILGFHKRSGQSQLIMD